jgi:hypothetical protein
MLVGSGFPGGPVEQYLSRRDASCGLMGVSLEVGSVKRALGTIQKGIASTLEPYGGLFGTSVLIPPASAHGLWIELFESSSAKGGSR